MPGRDTTEATNPGDNANYDNALGSPYHRTEVGEFELSVSPYGTFDQGGNVFEWNETKPFDYVPANRGVRGGSFNWPWNGMIAEQRVSAPPNHEDPSGNEGHIGFRVAAVIPEPSAAVLLSLGGLLLWFTATRNARSDKLQVCRAYASRWIRNWRARSERGLRTWVLVGWSAATLAIAATRAQGVTLDTVMVDNPDNAPDQFYASFQNPYNLQFGAVNYTFRISKHEISNGQYAEFLNVVDPAGVNLNGLYNSDMSANARGGIDFFGGNSPGTKYVVKNNMGNKPVNFHSWFDAARFANWLHNGQGSGSTETGAYDLSQSLPQRLPGAKWFLPTEDEWYKAAYHHPVAQGGDADGYWLYPTRTNSVPTVATADLDGEITNPGGNVANYDSGADWNGQDGNVTSVGGAGFASRSFYGTADQGGNVWEWTETDYVANPGKVIRGAGWNFPELGMRASYRDSLNPSVGDGTGDTIGVVGFRVAAAVPEPMLAAILLSAVPGFALRRRSRIARRGT